MTAFALVYLVLAYFTWVCFLAAMSLIAAKKAGKLPVTAEILGWPLIIVGGFADFLLNIASSVLFLELPREWFLTQRCDRHLRDSSGWRRLRAQQICSNLLDPFQIGGHCH